jgi:hypothetical protein
MNDLFQQPAPPEVILLDYVQTLVSNGNDPRRDAYQKAGRYREWIAKETFRPWLLTLLKAYQASGGKVILLTARSAKYQKETLAQIASKGGGFKPDAAFFNPGELEPPTAKRWNIERHIVPKYGPITQTRYLALESNGKTRAMFTKIGIPALPVPYAEPVWTRLPTLPL